MAFVVSVVPVQVVPDVADSARKIAAHLHTLPVVVEVLVLRVAVRLDSRHFIDRGPRQHGERLFTFVVCFSFFLHVFSLKFYRVPTCSRRSRKGRRAGKPLFPQHFAIPASS